MTFQSTTRYPSLAYAASDAPTSPLVLDGLEVVDEQVVLMAPLDATRSAAIRPERRGTHAVG